MSIALSAAGVESRRAHRVSRWISGVAIAALLGTLLVGIQSTAAPAPAAEAASAANWDPGYIIDDSIFYDSTSMNANEVQGFLNSQIGQCDIAAYLCLNGYGKPTETRPADRYCAAYQGAPYQTAAQIIDGVARACGINQRVLLVLLQKEQGLVTSTAPSARAYEAATGMSCPDSAGCDPQFAGFFYQVYFAARQFQIYRLNPGNFGYRAQQWNNIQYNPNTDCGAQSVYIANQATAALYIYTPYVPNTAALGNLYGTGDGCSSYGNRNFWRIFSDWFGDPHSFTVHPGFASYWASQGGAGGQMGRPTSYLITLSENGGGSYQRFQGGVAYASYQAGTAFVANNVFGQKYASYGGAAGSLGWPSTEQLCAASGVCYQVFTGGTITWSASTGAQVVGGGLSAIWAQFGGVYGLGAALAPTDFSQKANGIGWSQRFTGGTIVQSVAGIFLVPHNAIEASWLGTGGGGGFYGWPTNAYSCASTSCAQTFQGGVLSTTPGNGTHAILWGMQSYWEQNGALNDLGAATTDLRGSSVGGGGWVQKFATGGLTLRPDGTTIRIPEAIWSTWDGAGAEAYYGWPTASATCADGTCVQRFEYAAITSSPQGNFAIVGGFIPAWDAFGGLGTVGSAAAALRYGQANGGGWSQQFSGGVITQASGSAAIFTPVSPILSTWQYYGGEGTWLGWPTAAQSCNGTNCTQQFQHGTAISNSGGVMFAG